MSKSKYEPGKYEVKAKRSSAGLGLFALEGIPKGACIIEYVGRVISDEEQYTSRSQYLFEVNSKITIDGVARSNLARYINHSCRPNAEPEIYKRRIFIMARRTIKAGEEISYDYGKEHWNAHIKPKGCRCPKCQSKKETLAT
ncbi:MAG TPA: SET domain-containing protein [Candidatus Paceibacterota bacterium]|nr:SET domain-containing protein [Candidatus Paceibacterota bacterium]